MSLLTLGILLLAVAGTLVFVRQITRPLMALAHATQRIDHGEVGVRVSVRGQDEVGRLAASFNSMVVRIEESTQGLEEKGVELERANQQTSTFCSVVREIGALRNLNELGAYLVEKIQDILRCGPHMVLFFLTQNRASLFVLSQNDITLLDNPDATKAAIALLTGLKKATFIERIPIHLPLVDRSFQEADRCAVAPLEHEDQVFGALAVACPKMCECDAKGLDTVCLILNQAAGVIKRAVLHEEETRDIQRRLEISSEFSGIVGKDPKMQAVYKLIDDISATDATVLIQGESGTGKEVVARAIQQRSLRKDKPFVVIDCSAYPATLLESELFGHEKGAFTGATRQKAGRFEQADGGTVFLDEIGEISPSAQIKFLRVLQSQRFERLGGEKILAVNVRILAATNKDLIQEVKSGRFREDLFYRLNVIPIHLPPLRERRNDIPTLVRHFLGRFAVEQKKSVQELSPEAMRILLDYPWPGNVRELENSIEHAVVLAKAGRIEAADLPSLIVRAAGNLSAEGIPQIGRIAKREQELLRETLEECSWNKKEAARRLGISRSTLYDKLKKYQLARRATH
jgi:two-component system response regulator HydG